MIREKEKAEFAAASGEQKEDLEALTGAIAAIEKGMGSFLQTPAARKAIRAAKKSTAVDDYEKSQVMAFLQGKQNPFGDYSPASGEIMGILKAMRDEMDKDLNGAISAEDAAAAGFEELAAAKKSEIAAASAAIESKTVRSGELAVATTTTADDIEDTTAEMKETQAFIANLASQCATKKKEWAERQKMRAEEVSAISEAIKILNDDDALDLFKKTLSLTQTSSQMGFIQKTSQSTNVLRARRMVSALMKKGSPHRAELALIEMSMKSRAVDFSKIMAMIVGTDEEGIP